MKPATPEVRPGRPRKFETNGDRQKAYRERKIAEQPQQPPEPPTSDDPIAWNRYLSAVGLSTSEGRFLSGAPHGKGQLVTGGYDSTKVAAVAEAHRRDENGRRVRPGGHGPDPEEAPASTKDFSVREAQARREIEDLESSLKAAEDAKNVTKLIPNRGLKFRKQHKTKDVQGLVA